MPLEVYKMLLSKLRIHHTIRIIPISPEKILANILKIFNRRFDGLKEMNLSKNLTYNYVIQKQSKTEGNIDSKEMNQITPDF